MTRPNAQQIEHWNQISGPKWVALADTIDLQIRPIGEEALERARVRAGERVLDVGCGCGQTSLTLASRVGPTGRVLGIDVSAPMLAEARARAARAAHDHLDFLEADAQVHPVETGAFDLLFSRFGVMFFDRPVAAFANLRRALRDEGRLCFVCWQSLASNPWMSLPAQAAARHVALPAPPDPESPGPFAFADAERVRGVLARAGFRDVACDDYSGELAVGAGRSLDDIVGFLQQMGPAGAALRAASDEQRQRATDAMRSALAPHYDGEALVMGFATWMVTARV